MSQKLYNEYRKFEFCEKNGLNFKLNHRNAQKFILSGRFGALIGRPGDLMKNLETPGKTGRVGTQKKQGLDWTVETWIGLFELRDVSIPTH